MSTLTNISARTKESFVQKYPLPAFFLLAVGLTWMFLITDALGSQGILPFRLPTQNLLDALSLRRRMALKRFIRDLVSQSIIEAGGSQTPQGEVLRLPWTELLEAEYCRMTARSTSRRSAKRGGKGRAMRR